MVFDGTLEELELLAEGGGCPTDFSRIFFKA